MATTADVLKAPFPYPGGKSRVADVVWERLGDVQNYCEPFMGSLAVLLRRPADHFRTGYRVETANDLNHYLCLGPDTRILRSDLTWGRAGEIAEGDTLIGFDEFNGPTRPGSRAPSEYRRWRTTTVTGVARTVKPCYRLRFDTGPPIIASADHQWLCGSKESGQRGWRWLTTEQLTTGDKGSNALRLCDVTEREESWEAGWLAGLFDGEGSVAAKVGWRLCLAQNQGITLDRAVRYLTDRGFRFGRTDREKGCSVLTVAGGMREVLRLLMLVRPERLIRNAVSKIENFSLYGRQHHSALLMSKEFIGDQETVAIETDRHTFIAEGLASHNCNFWRAVRADPEKVAEYADWPVTEADLHARHKWLVRSAEVAAWRERMRTDPEAFDAKIAGWWVWGACCWIGGAWCAHKIDQNNMPLLDPSQKGVHRRDGADKEKMPNIGQECATGGVGVHGVGGRPQLTDAFDIGRGVNAGGGLHDRRVAISQPGWGVHADYTVGTCDARRAWLVAWMRRLSDRLRLVRTCYGHWSRVCDSESTMTRLGLTGVFLDPPYPANRSDTGARSRDASLYATDKGADLDALRDEVLDWCRRWGGNKSVRAAVCGYEGDGYESLVAEGWAEHAWEASGGYGNQRRAGKGKAENARRERIWFSPFCLAAEAGPDLFSGVA